MPTWNRAFSLRECPCLNVKTDIREIGHKATKITKEEREGASRLFEPLRAGSIMRETPLTNLLEIFLKQIFS